MNASSNNQDDKLREAIRSELNREPFPPKAQVKLEEAYASLHVIPQDKGGVQSQAPSQPQPQPPSRPSARPAVHHRTAREKTHGVSAKTGKRVVKRSVVVAIAAAFVVLLGGTAFAASSLLQMKPGEVPFFNNSSNLPIYNSLQTGVASLNTEVGESVLMGDTTVTLDTISTDRNIVNLFFTLEKEDGFDLASASIYEGSNESEWVRLQRIAPRFSYSISSAGEPLGEGSVSLLDAYLENGQVKCLMRLVPKTVLPDEVSLSLKGTLISENSERGYEEYPPLEVGLDLSTIMLPDELGAQELVFHTSAGEKALGIERFTRSELGTVFVARNDETWAEDGMSYGTPETSLYPGMLKITDDQGEALHFVQAGDGGGMSGSDFYVMELSGLSKEAKSVTFTPMGLSESALEQQDSVEARKAYSESHQPQQIDVSQIGAQLPTSEYGGYELTDWDIANSTVTISLKPYGWVSGGPHSGGLELIPNEEIPYLVSEHVDSSTGETFTGGHSSIMYRKFDYQTGEMMHIVSYYAATDEELREVNLYTYSPAFDSYIEETTAAQTLSFSQE